MANVRNNQHRLITPFDLHETLHSVLDIEEAKKPVNYSSRGISLLQEIPANRTCDSADIATHWCTCLNYQVRITFSIPGRFLSNTCFHTLESVTYLVLYGSMGRQLLSYIGPRIYTADNVITLHKT